MRTTEHNLRNDIEENTFEPIEENAFESAQEACCPEESGDRDRNAETSALTTVPTLEEVREEWIQKYGHISEIDTYVALYKKMRIGEPMTMEEDRTFLKLLAFFHPHEANIKAYETFETLTSKLGPHGTYKSTHGLRE